MRTRNHDWFDENTHEVHYGFQILTGDGWKNVAEDGKPCIYKKKADRDRKRREYSKRSAVPASRLRTV